jgi:hypothetical protein
MISEMEHLAAGRLTEGEAMEIVEGFFVRVSETEFLLDNGAKPCRGWQFGEDDAHFRRD